MALTCLATTTPPAVGKARSPVVGKPPARGRHRPRAPESQSRETPRPPARSHSSVVREVGRYRRERRPKERERSAQVWTVRLSLVSSFLPPLSCGLWRGRLTCPLFSSHLRFSESQLFSFYHKFPLAKRQPRGKPLVRGEIHDLLPRFQDSLLRQRTQHLLLRNPFLHSVKICTLTPFP